MLASLQRSGKAARKLLHPGPRRHTPFCQQPRLCHNLKRGALIVAASADVEESNVQELLARDRKLIQSLSDAETSMAPKRDADTQEEVDGKVTNTRKRKRDVARTPALPSVQEATDISFKRCRDAINAGSDCFQKKDYAQAIQMFRLALELPGSGAYRLPGSPREYSCASEAEENTALYNMACAYAQMGQLSSVITCLEAVLDNGFDQYDTIRNDPDLAPARGPQLDSLLAKYDNPVAKIKKMFSAPETTKSDTKGKPWLLW